MSKSKSKSAKEEPTLKQLTLEGSSVTKVTTAFSFGGREKMQSCRRDVRILLLTVFLAFLNSIPQNVLAQECELNCKTKNCSPEGVCICDTPTPETLLTGDRNFLGGVFCDVPSVMCDGSDTFYCQSGGICNELVQGENYTCTCPSGFTGEHCNLAGELCGGSIYCYNGGICPGELIGKSSCTCPEDFLGSKDCSIPTPIALPPAPIPQVVINSSHDIYKWWKPVGIVTAIILSVSFMSRLALRCYKQRTSKLSQIRFQELRQLQINDGEDFYNDDEDDPFKDQNVGNGKSFS